MKITKALKKQLLAAKSLRLDFTAVPGVPSYARDVRSVEVISVDHVKTVNRTIFTDAGFVDGARRFGLSGCVRGVDSADGRVWCLLWSYLSPEVMTAFRLLREGDEAVFEIRRNDWQTPNLRCRRVSVDRLVLVVFRGKRIFEFNLDVVHTTY